MHQVASRLQRPRMSQPFQIIPLLPHGSVRTTSLFVIYSQPRPTYYSIGPSYDALSSSKREGDLVIPTCQSSLNQVVGSLKVGRQQAARERCCTPHSLPLVRYETSELSNRHSSSLHNPLSAQACLEQHTRPPRKPHPHFLLSDRLGSIRMKRSILPKASEEACADYSQ